MFAISILSSLYVSVLFLTSVLKCDFYFWISKKIGFKMWLLRNGKVVLKIFIIMPPFFQPIHLSIKPVLEFYGLKWNSSVQVLYISPLRLVQNENNNTHKWALRGKGVNALDVCSPYIRITLSCILSRASNSRNTVNFTSSSLVIVRWAKRRTRGDMSKDRPVTGSTHRRGAAVRLTRVSARYRYRRCLARRPPPRIQRPRDRWTPIALCSLEVRLTHQYYTCTWSSCGGYRLTWIWKFHRSIVTLTFY